MGGWVRLSGVFLGLGWAGLGWVVELNVLRDNGCPWICYLLMFNVYSAALGRAGSGWYGMVCVLGLVGGGGTLKSSG